MIVPPVLEAGIGGEVVFPFDGVYFRIEVKSRLRASDTTDFVDSSLRVNSSRERRFVANMPNASSPHPSTRLLASNPTSGREANTLHRALSLKKINVGRRLVSMLCIAGRTLWNFGPDPTVEGVSRWHVLDQPHDVGDPLAYLVRYLTHTTFLERVRPFGLEAAAGGGVGMFPPDLLGLV